MCEIGNCQKLCANFWGIFGAGLAPGPKYWGTIKISTYWPCVLSFWLDD